MATRRDRSRLPILALVVCAAMVSGCAQWRWPQIDPSGEHVFVPASETPSADREVPSSLCGPKQLSVTLSPRALVAPVGAEVVLLGGVLGEDNYLTTNARMEWMIAQGSVGHFVNIDESSCWNYLVLDFTRPHKVSETYAIGTTSRQTQQLTRGTPSPQDDVYVLSGQTWITLTSPVEGTSYVTAFSPEVRTWEGRQRSATIHWIDAQWQFPPPSVNPAGTKHVFTTTLTRLTSHGPVAGWLVRYQILDGPPAGFAPNGATVVEVPTNPLGQASVEIFQKQPAHGTNRVAIQVIRPEMPGGQRVVVGSGATSKTWSAPQMSLLKTGPAAVAVGATLSYRIQLSNPGDQPADQVVLTDEVPQGAVCLGSNPQAESDGGRLRWNVGTLPPGTARVFEVSLRADRPGSLNACAEAVTPSGLRARNCIATTVTPTPLMSAPAPCSPASPPRAAPAVSAPCPAAPLASAAPPAGPAAPSTPAPSAPPAAKVRIELRIEGREQATVDEKVKYQITVTNTGTAPASGLKLVDQLSPGLLHAENKRRIEYPRSTTLSLAAGESRTVPVEFLVTLAGTLSQTVTVVDSSGTVLARQEKTLTAVAAPGSSIRNPLVPSLPRPMQPQAQAAPPQGLPPQPDGAQPLVPPGAQPPVAQPPKTEPPAPPAKGQVRVMVAGPTAALNVGDPAPFDIEVSNPGPASLSNIQVTAEIDPALELVKGPGVTNPLAWTIATLPANGTPERFRIECRCKQPALQACVRVQATAADGVQDQTQACFAIRPAPALGAPLSLTMVDLADPIRVGKEETYVMKVKSGSLPDSNVVLTVTLPKELKPERIVSRGQAGGGKIEGQTVEFDPVSQLFPGQSLDYRVVATALEPGTAEVTATLRSQNSRGQQTLTEKTEILPAQ